MGACVVSGIDTGDGTGFSFCVWTGGSIIGAGVGVLVGFRVGVGSDNVGFDVNSFSCLVVGLCDAMGVG